MISNINDHPEKIYLVYKMREETFRRKWIAKQLERYEHVILLERTKKAVQTSAVHVRHEGIGAAFGKAGERMGTVSVMTNLKVSGQIVYDMLKSRADMEQSYDMFKNIIHADRSYMRDDQQLQGWTFVNFVALILHYRIYSLLKKSNLLRKYSPEDILMHLERVGMLNIGNEWKMSEIPKKSRDIIEAPRIPIMQKSES